MRNPASELAALLSSWQSVTSGQNVNAVRGIDTDASRQIRAGFLLAEVVRSIDALERAGEDVSGFRVFQRDWFLAVYAPNVNWADIQNAAGGVLNEQHIAALKMFGSYLDKTSLRPYVPEAASLAGSRAALAELVGLLGSDELKIDEPTKLYLFTLIDEVRSVLDADGAEVTIDLVRRINELSGAVHRIAEQVGGDTGGRLRKAAARVLPVAVPVMSVAGYVLDKAADLQALTGH